MTESRAWRACSLLCAAAVGCGASSAELRLQRERDELRHEVVEVQQYNADLKFRMQLAEARNKVLIDLVQGLSSDPEHWEPRHGSGGQADAALQALDRDIEALVANVRHSHSDLDALRAQRAALQSELTQARHAIEEARAAQSEQDAHITALRALLAPLLPLIHAGRINVRMQYGQLTLQLQENTLFLAGAAELTAEGKTLLGRVAEGLRTASDRQYRITGPAEETSKREATQRQLSAARSLAVSNYLTECGVLAANLIAATHASAHAANGDRYIEVAVLPKFAELPGLPSSEELLRTPSERSPQPSAATPPEPASAPEPPAQ